MKRMPGLLIALSLLIILTGGPVLAGGKWKPRPPRKEYGNVVINNFSEENQIPPVVFTHWIHRSKYTCRLCHIDIGFAMEAGKTMITEEENENGLYCGACHNWKEAFGPEEKGLLGKTVKKNCPRCHSFGTKDKYNKKFSQYTKYFPRGRFGNGIDWMKAEDGGLVSLKDYLEGFSNRLEPLKYSMDLELKAKIKEMPDIIFSHLKHAVWNGCELCHPDIFGFKKSASVYSMQDIVEGKYCGVCHGKVAFPNLECRRCHTKDVDY